MSVSNLLKVVLHWSGHGEEGALSFHYAGGAGGHTAAQLNAAAAAAVAAATSDASPGSLTSFRGLLDTAQSIDQLSVYEYATAPGKATAQGVSTQSLAGTGAISHPLQTALVASLRTASAGARHRGRLYFPAHTLGILAPSTLVPPLDQQKVANVAIGLAEAFRTGLGSSLQSNSLQYVVYSPTAGATTPVTEIRVDNKFDTQRRRESSLKATVTESRSNGLP